MDSGEGFEILKCMAPTESELKTAAAGNNVKCSMFFGNALCHVFVLLKVFSRLYENVLVLLKKNLFRFKTCVLSVSKCTLSVLKMSFSVWNVFFACPTMSFVHLLLMVREAAPDLVSKGGYPPGGLLLSLLTVGQRESFRSHHASK